MPAQTRPPHDPFPLYLRRLLKREGGFVDHPDDKGGPTNFGITQKTLSSWLGRPASREEVVQLDPGVAAALYRARYYEEPGFTQLPTSIQEQLFDAAVHHGPRQAVLFLQSVLNQAGFGPLTRDGVLGSKTLAAASAASEAMGPFFGNALADERRLFLENLVRHNPRQAVFLKGWLRRAESFKERIDP